ncbi:phage antirepressor KilAC domain-containing protein [Klebsiella michiganensis]|nr:MULTISPECIES: phage antirepressor KilAC domain-containing protein [Klebsiella]MBZ7661056.1 DNA-binding protein [Klebsiella grimontii]WJD77946.1 phage antirepressor KilAC domain-containing protein [Klebsiella michiganensis]
MTKHTLAVHDQVVTMSSLDIAGLVGKRHDNVKRTIETLIERGVITSPQIEEKPTAGRPTAIYVFEGEYGKRDSIIVVAQLSPEFTARLVDRWQELEAQIAKPAFDPMVALNDAEFLRGTLLTYSEKVIALEYQVDEMKPDVQALERIAKADGSMCITDTAKHLQVQPKFLFKLLSERHWIYRRAGGKAWLGYQEKIQAGHLEHKVTTVSRSDGSEKIVEQVLITAKGITKLSKLLGVSAAA